LTLDKKKQLSRPLVLPDQRKAKRTLGWNSVKCPRHC